MLVFFFFQAEDGIRDLYVTGVQTCALPILLGLFAFFYGTLHFLTYIWFDKGFVLHDMIADIAQRPFITMGLTGFTLMIPLALTSTAWAIRKMGGKRWQILHRLIYASAIAGVIHYLWLVKADLTKPLQYAAFFGLLLLYRIVEWVKAKPGKRKVLRRPMEVSG